MATVVRETDSDGVTRYVEDGATRLVLTPDDYEVGAGETLVEVTNTDAPRVVTIPSPFLVEPGQRLTIKDGSGTCDGTNTITVQAPPLTPDVDQLRWRASLATTGEDLEVDAATAAALPAYTAASGVLTASAHGALGIDGISVSASDVVLVKDEADPVRNGIYVVTDAGTDDASEEVLDGTSWVLTRSTSFDEDDEALPGYLVEATAGDVNASTFWVLRGGIDSAPSLTILTAFDQVVLYANGRAWRVLVGAQPGS